MSKHPDVNKTLRTLYLLIILVTVVFLLGIGALIGEAI